MRPERTCIQSQRGGLPGHILYGSDTLYANNDIIKLHTSRQGLYQFGDPNLAAQINRQNALSFVP